MKNETSKKRILHVDDEQDTLDVVNTLLTKEGYEVVSVSQGTQALKEVESNGFSLLILDVMMPGMSGWDLFSKIGQIKPDYKVVFLSILEANEERMKDINAMGVKDYIRKPFQVDDFISRINKVIND